MYSDRPAGLLIYLSESLPLRANNKTRASGSLLMIHPLTSFPADWKGSCGESRATCPFSLPRSTRAVRPAPANDPLERSGSRPINNRSNQQRCWLFSTDEMGRAAGGAIISVADDVEPFVFQKYYICGFNFTANSSISVHQNMFSFFFFLNDPSQSCSQQHHYGAFYPVNRGVIINIATSTWKPILITLLPRRLRDLTTIQLPKKLQ